MYILLIDLIMNHINHLQLEAQTYLIATATTTTTAVYIESE